MVSYCQMLLPLSQHLLSHFRCPANQVAVVDEVTGLLHCAPSPCGPTTCRNGGTCLAHSTKSYQCRCPEGFRGQWCEIGRVKSLRLAALSPSSILAISMCLLVFFGNCHGSYTFHESVVMSLSSVWHRDEPLLFCVSLLRKLSIESQHTEVRVTRRACVCALKP